MNIQRYVGNSPINSIDPSGMESIPSQQPLVFQFPSPVPYPRQFGLCRDEYEAWMEQRARGWIDPRDGSFNVNAHWQDMLRIGEARRLEAAKVQAGMDAIAVATMHAGIVMRLSTGAVTAARVNQMSSAQAAAAMTVQRAAAAAEAAKAAAIAAQRARTAEIMMRERMAAPRPPNPARTTPRPPYEQPNFPYHEY
jgi:hypothetical protein